MRQIARKGWPLLVAGLVLAALAGAGVRATLAAFSATTENSGNSFTAAAAFDGVLRMATGGYTGNATDNRGISIGFQPDYVIVKADTTQIAVARTSTMSGDASKPLGGATAFGTNRIQSLDSGGFTIGTNAQVNSNGVQYHWVAFREAPGAVAVGSYTGNGTSQSPSTTFSPEHVAVLGPNATYAIQRFTGMTTSFRFDSGTASANGINSLDGTGFTVGNAAETNTNGALYHYVAFNEVSGAIQRGTYTGDGNDNRQLTPLGFQPDYVNIRANDTVTARAGHSRSAALGGTSSQFFNATANSTNAIQALLSQGFELGTDAYVNANGPTYHYMAYKNTGGGCSVQGSQTIASSGDAWLDEAAPSTNLGNDSVLKVTSKSPANDTRAIVGFNLPSIPSGCSVSSATLRVYNKSPISGRTIEALRNTASWSEGSVNWTNQPATAAGAATATTPASAGWMQWNVLTQVQAMYAAGQSYGFKIKDQTENGGGIEQQFESEESGVTQAELVLTVG